MMRFAYLFAGGGAFYPALLGCIVGLIVLRTVRSQRLFRVGRIVVVLSAVVAVLCSVPLPVWLYLVWAFTLIAASSTLARAETFKSRTRSAILAASLAITIALMAAEAPYRVLPNVPYKSGGVLYTLGDSLSMGADTMEGNWPALLAKQAGMDVHAFAFGGARLGTAMGNADRVQSDADLIIVELGGNDIFYDTPAATFANELDTMLEKLTRHGASVVLLELPLPPFYNHFGADQRCLAAKHGVVLIPKSVLAHVLAAPGATVDGLHLSSAGHLRLADALWGLRE